MKRRQFVKTASAITTGTVLSPLFSCSTGSTEIQNTTIKNWAGNLIYATDEVAYPAKVEEIQQLVREQKKLRALGTQHCFNRIADSKHYLLSQKNRQQLVRIDKEKSEVTVEAGTRYGDFCKIIDNEGFALRNLASLPHISVVGAAATATHGSGVGNGGLATELVGFTFINANGDLVQVSKENTAEVFNGLAVHLGCVGVITEATLKLEPTYQVEQRVYRNLPMAALENHFEEIMSAGYSVSLFTDWQNESVNQVWIKSRVDAESIISDPEFFGAQLADRNMHPIDTESSENCTDQMGVAGPWFDRLPHFKMDFTPSKGDELQAEFHVPFGDAFKAMKQIELIKDDVFPHLFISEIRSIAGDEIWMSPFYNQKSVAIHFTLKPHKEVVSTVIPKIEAALEPFNVRPHWGKLFTLPGQIVQSKYAKLNDFKALVAEYDPEGKFRNDFIQKALYS